MLKANIANQQTTNKIKLKQTKSKQAEVSKQTANKRQTNSKQTANKRQTNSKLRQSKNQTNKGNRPAPTHQNNFKIIDQAKTKPKQSKPKQN